MLKRVLGLCCGMEVGTKVTAEKIEQISLVTMLIEIHRMLC